MNLVRGGMLFAAVGLLVTLGCGGHKLFPESSLTGAVYEVKVGESINPVDVTAKRGDEIRWINVGNRPVDVSVVQTQEELISCQKGFASTNLGYLFGTSEYENIVLATVRPNEYAGLCFSLPGKYSYTVRKGPPTESSSNKLTGSITVQ